ncbi:hypothetical protein N658DRAFT_190230 [Parathielavia hyrcaniae]|uniref:Uncharacterized protein n=1 Tax=Parathielavia hyrcaniae TaxID=113614 RepID=A0AAN6T4U0_9PEZI|nr:hypothetical protein N658DRAFT_190230 [Parathielavia hyrcaniae]
MSSRSSTVWVSRSRARSEHMACRVRWSAILVNNDKDSRHIDQDPGIVHRTLAGRKGMLKSAQPRESHCTYDVNLASNLKGMESTGTLHAMGWVFSWSCRAASRISVMFETSRSWKCGVAMSGSSASWRPPTCFLSSDEDQGSCNMANKVLLLQTREQSQLTGDGKAKAIRAYGSGGKYPKTAISGVEPQTRSDSLATPKPLAVPTNAGTGP